MDILLLIQAVIMGIVEGITEFLPISSIGYLILSADLMGFWTKDKVDLFIVVVQLGLFWQSFMTIGDDCGKRSQG